MSSITTDSSFRDGQESETIGSFYFHWEPPALWEIETDEGFALDDLMAELGRWELNALGYVKHGYVPQEPRGER
jgi:hypothetical protein